MKRRDFIRTGCIMCLAGPVVFSLLESCQSLPIYKTTSAQKKITVPFDQFTESNFVIVRPSDTNYDIAVIKNSTESYSSFKMTCTHADNPVRFNGERFTCNLHGSVFSKNGEVTKGPAEKSLISFNTKIENNSLTINLI